MKRVLRLPRALWRGLRAAAARLGGAPRWAQGLLAVAVVAAVAVGIAVGGGDDSDTLKGARAEFVSACTNGESDQEAQCRCVAGELEKKHSYRRARDFARADEQVREGRLPQQLAVSMQTCARQAPPAAAP